jgi:protoporphyrinogen oxidase
VDQANTIILGGGVTGLAAGISSGAAVFEATDFPGGICSSYYLAPHATQRIHHAPADGNAYRFEIGGGHWIFGGDPAVLEFIRSLTPVSSYARRSSVYLPSQQIYAPFPIQNHLRALGPDLAAKAVSEMSSPGGGEVTSLKQWLARSFGPTLFDLFFDGFNRLYTAGLYDRIAPQDGYKSPVNLDLVKKGASGDSPAVGYNTQYLYPSEGLDALTRRMAERCTIHYGRRVESIDLRARSVGFAGGASIRYQRLISTLPLDQMLRFTGIPVAAEPDPYTSVLVTNIGAAKAPKCPGDHWVYVPASRAGFHRVGFYSNVSNTFLPSSLRQRGSHVSIYVERAYPGGAKPSDAELAAYAKELVRELQDWGYIADVDVLDHTWVNTAYTWSWPGSTWRGEALAALEAQGIFQVGRYGRWVFQGIADSIRDGFIVGSAFKD